MSGLTWRRAHGQAATGVGVSVPMAGDTVEYTVELLPLDGGRTAAGTRSLRVARIGTLPRQAVPGMGLPAYKMTSLLPHETLWITPRHDSPPVDLPDRTELVQLAFPWVESPPSGRPGPLSRLRRAWAACRFNAAALPRLLKWRPDLIHVHSPVSLPAALAARALVGARVVVSFHGSELGPVASSRTLRRLVACADRVLYLAGSMRATLQGFVAEERLDWIGNGVDRERFRPDPEAPRRPRIIAIGSLRWHKGFEDLLEAMARVHQQEPGWQLWIVGEGRLRSRLEARASELGIADRVTFTGMLDRDRVVEALQESSIYVLSSLTEGFPKALLEGMATGLPVVTTDVGGCAEAVGEAGLIVPPAQPEALATALLRLVRDPGERIARGDAARARSGLHSWDATVQRVDRAYRAAVAGRSS